MLARIAGRAASACRSRAALTVRHLSDAAAKQHERALEALDAGAPPEAVVPLFEAEGHGAGADNTVAGLPVDLR